MTDEILDPRELVLRLLKFAENCRIKGDPFHSRIALINYDNAFEICCHSIWKSDTCAKKIVEEIGEKRFRDFPGKLEFAMRYMVDCLHLPFEVAPEELSLFHRWRNELYHRGEGRLPDPEELALASSSATWTISRLLRLKVGERIPPINYYGDIWGFFIKDRFPTPQIRYLSSLANLHKIINRFLLQNQSQNVALFKLGVSDKYEYIQTHYPIFINIPLPKGFFDLGGKIVEEEELGISEISKVVKMSMKLKQVADNLETKMHDFQKKLYEDAIQWTVAGADQKTRIGIIQQPMGTGKTIVMMAYALELLKFINIPRHKILILTSHVATAEQVYASFVRGAPALGEKIALVESGEKLVANIENPNTWIIISTIQKIYHMNEHQFQNLQLAVIADDITDTMIESAMTILPCSSIVILTGTGYGRKHKIIAKLTLEEVENRGIFRI